MSPASPACSGLKWLRPPGPLLPQGQMAAVLKHRLRKRDVKSIQLGQFPIQACRSATMLLQALLLRTSCLLCPQAASTVRVHHGHQCGAKMAPARQRRRLPTDSTHPFCLPNLMIHLNPPLSNSTSSPPLSRPSPGPITPLTSPPPGHPRPAGHPGPAQVRGAPGGAAGSALHPAGGRPFRDPGAGGRRQRTVAGHRARCAGRDGVGSAGYVAAGRLLAPLGLAAPLHRGSWASKQEERLRRVSAVCPRLGTVPRPKT